jgi:4-hydroxyphenylpyruvate dioxygenase
LSVPDTYYETLRKRLAHSDLKIEEDLDRLEKLRILIDYDDK